VLRREQTRLDALRSVRGGTESDRGDGRRSELANFNVTQAETVEKNRQGRLDRILKGIETTGGGLPDQP